jgi:hypothetical protein
MNPQQGEAGTDPRIKWQVLPTGGIVVLNLASTALPSSWNLTRYVVDGSTLTDPVQLWDGGSDAIPVYIDLGDGGTQNVPLSPLSLYSYEFSTSTGSVSTETLCVSGTIVLEPDHMTKVMARAMQAGLAALSLPTQFTQRPSFSYAMPVSTPLRFPIVVMNLDLLQQQQIPIGQGIPAEIVNGLYNVPAQALRRYVLRVYTTNVDERDFYRDAIIGIFSSILVPLFQQIGQDVNHSYQAANGQIVGDQMQPGAFYAEIALQFSGLYNVGVSPYFPLIEHITSTVSGSIYSPPLTL